MTRYKTILKTYLDLTIVERTMKVADLFSVALIRGSSLKRGFFATLLFIYHWITLAELHDCNVNTKDGLVEFWVYLTGAQLNLYLHDLPRVSQSISRLRLPALGTSTPDQAHWFTKHLDPINKPRK